MLASQALIAECLLPAIESTMGLLSSLFLLLSFLLFLIYYKLTSTSRPKSQNPGPRLPPGPWKLPVIGSLHHLLGSLPHRSLRELASKHGPLMHLKLGEVSAVVVSSPEVAREIMKTHDITFASRPHMIVAEVFMYGGKDVLFAPYGEYWRHMKKVCMLELLSAKRVQSFRSIREEEAFNFMRSISLAGDSPVNLSSKLYALSNDVTFRAVMGDKCKQQATFLSVLNEAVQATAGLGLADLFPSSVLVNWITGSKAKVERSHRRLDVLLDGIIQERKDRRATKTESSTDGNTEDLLDVLLRIQDEGALTDDSVKAVIFDMLAAGSETSSTTMEWVMSELVRNPGAMKAAQLEVREVLSRTPRVSEADTGDLNYLKLVVKETLRLHAPAPLLAPRECRQSCQVLGYDIPEKTRVIVNAWAIGRDPRYWEDAEAFKPERFEGSQMDFRGANFEYIPFGAGRRICPGIQFGLANIEIVLAQLLYYYDWELPQPGGLDMAENFGISVGRKSNLCLRAILRIPLPTT